MLLRRAILAAAAIAALGASSAFGAWPNSGKYPSAAIYNPLGAMLPIDTMIGQAGALGVTNGKVLTIGFWINGDWNGSASGGTTGVGFQNGDLIVSDIATQCEVNNGAPAPGGCLSFDNSGTHGQFSFNNSVGLTTASDRVYMNLVSSSNAPSNGVWTYYTMSWDTGSAGGPYCALYNGRTNLNTGCGAIVANALIDLNNYQGFYINATATAWYADVFVDQETMVCKASGTLSDGTADANCTAANMIPSDLLNKFLTAGGLPVNPGTNGHLATRSGSTPAVYMSFNPGSIAANAGASGTFSQMRAASPSYRTTITACTTCSGAGPLSVTVASAAGFVVGNGVSSLDRQTIPPGSTISSVSGTTIGITCASACGTVWTGSGTYNIGTWGFTSIAATGASPAPYGPAGIGSQPTMKWVQYYNGATYKTSGYTVSFNGNPVTAGDLLIVMPVLTDGSNLGTHTMTCPGVETNGTTWTQVYGGYDTTGDTDTELCWAIVKSGDQATTPAITWSGAAASRSGAYIIADYANVNQSSPVGYSGRLVSATAGQVKTPAGTTTTNGSTLASLFEAVNANKTYTITSFVPSPDALRWIQPVNGGSGIPMTIVSDAYNVASGTSTQKIATKTADGGIGFSLELKHQ